MFFAVHTSSTAVMFVEEASSYLAYQRQSQHLMLLSYFILKKALAPGKLKWQIRLGSKLKTFLSLLNPYVFLFVADKNQ